MWRISHRAPARQKVISLRSSNYPSACAADRTRRRPMCVQCICACTHTFMFMLVSFVRLCVKIYYRKDARHATRSFVSVRGGRLRVRVHFALGAKCVPDTQYIREGIIILRLSCAMCVTAQSRLSHKAAALATYASHATTIVPTSTPHHLIANSVRHACFLVQSDWFSLFSFV